MVLCVCQGESALIHAAAKGFTEIVGILIQGGADIDLQDNQVSSADWVYQMLIMVHCVPGKHCTILCQGLQSHRDRPIA